EDTFIYLNSTALRRSLFKPDKAGYALLPAELEMLPADLLRTAMQPLIDLMAEDDGWERLVAQFDGYSLLDFFQECTLSPQALEMIGPLFNLEGRLHFSLVEWFIHYYEDVFGDLV